MAWVRFTQTCALRDGSATFEQGKVYELNEASAQRWIRRSKAVAVNGPDKPSVPETAAVEPAETAVKPQGRPRKLK